MLPLGYMYRKNKNFITIAISVVSIFWFIIYVVNIIIQTPLHSFKESELISSVNKSLWRHASIDEPLPRADADRMEEQRKWIKDFSLSKSFRSKKAKRILIADKWEYYYGASENIKCSYAPDLDSKCHFFRDKSLHPYLQEMEHFDGIVGTRNWEFRLYENLIPKSSQQFLFILESPFVATPSIDLSRNNAILASYWRGSDISIPYYKWKNHFHKPVDTTEAKPNYAENKTKLAAVAISNCADYNGRIKYVRELQKYIQVDFYGKCGDLQCSPNCFEDLGEKYKFYLSFENSNCRDYITEKFFKNALMNNMVPVAFGAHPQDYESLAPPNSYIHVENFSNPQDLALYLEKLDKNDELYNKYFAWKGTGEIDSDSANDFFCRVCGMLFYSEFHKPPKWKQGSYWKDVNQCLESNKWYWSRS